MLKRTKGFTLAELMITVAIGAILASIVVPMGNMYRKNRNVSLINEFARSIQLARTEAIKRGERVIICRGEEINPDSVDSTIQEIECNPPADITSWDTGWIVYVDSTAGNGITNGTKVDGGVGGETADDDLILQRHGPIPSDYRLVGPNRNRIIIQANGLTPASNGTWTLCDPSNDNRLAQAVILSVTARVRLAQDSDGDGIKEGPGGAELSCG